MANKRIPFKYVSHEVRVALATKLDIRHIDGYDWRYLAEKLGRKYEEILAIQDNIKGKTMTILCDYSCEVGNDVHTVLDILQEMNRKDAYDVLYDALPSIKRSMRMESSECGRRTSSEHDCGGGCCHSSVMQQRSFLPNAAPSHHDYSLSPSNRMIKRSRSSVDAHPRVDYAGCYQSVGREGHDHYPRDSACQGVPKTVFAQMHYPSQRCYHTHADNGSRLLSPEKMEVGAEEVVCTSSEESPPPERRSKNIIQRLKSEETAIKQPMHMDYRRTVSVDARPLPRTIPLYIVNKPPYPDSDTKSSRATGSSLEQLQSLVNHQPELKRGGDAAAKIDVPKMEVDNEPVIDGSCSERSICKPRLTNNSNREETGNKKGNTFPRSVKAALPMKESTQQQTRPKLSKSTPKDMKLSSDTGWRNIKVFVTYSFDSKQYMQTIVSLVECFRNNGFICNSDITHRFLEQEPRGWLKNKYMEADFVLVCVSPGYPPALEADDDVNSFENYTEHQLHAKYIYHLMLSDSTNGSRHRYVPLLMRNESMRNIPRLLKNNYSFKWSEQSKDLMFMMTHPEKKLRAMIMDRRR